MNIDCYPKEFRDKLNRIVYVVNSEFEKIIYTYYGNTNKIKIKYYYFRKNIYFDVFSNSGEVILSNMSNNVLESKIEKKYDGTLDFIIHPKKLKMFNNTK